MKHFKEGFSIGFNMQYLSAIANFFFIFLMGADNVI